ncbi:MAG: hypothetical protein CHACPFDD_03234 [Phycisphaerae bacterium]|nr:hypothetical protein [Phycisphaerae bacterium]
MNIEPSVTAAAQANIGSAVAIRVQRIAMDQAEQVATQLIAQLGEIADHAEQAGDGRIDAYA